MAKRIISTTLAVVMFLCAIVAASFGSRAAKIEQAGSDIIYIPTTTVTTTQTTTHSTTATTRSPFLVPGYWITTVPDGPFKTSSNLLSTTHQQSETTTLTQPTSETTTETTTVASTTTVTTTTTTAKTTTTTKPTTTTAKPTTTTSKPVSYNVNNAKYAMLYDYTNGKILFEKNAYAKCYPASTTKLLTASVALHYMSENEIITVGNEIEMVGYNSSVCGIQKGYKMTLSQLIMGLMIDSGNDAAYTIAVNVARKHSGNKNMSNQAAIEYFASLMNSYARQLGATSSNFVNPDGYHDPKHYSTVHDLLLITKNAMQFQTIKKAGSTYKMEVLLLSGEKMTFKSTNALINPNSKYYYSSATGLKTGTTSAAGNCLISTAKKNNRILIAITISSPTDAGRYIDTINMFNAAF